MEATTTLILDRGKVVIIGCSGAGAMAARMLKNLNSSLEVTIPIALASQAIFKELYRSSKDVQKRSLKVVRRKAKE
ncbi:MAG: hypothetical protein J7K37_05860 [Candidatus Omnitrophica bacterium]|nr:hypothetical protein [Candidatus Omnitrophota bacterium]